jgi:DNA mismatch repair protein MutL
MTNKIKILPQSESIKIAAGEVIERPAHLIKELLENSLDAGAKNITLHLHHAGKTSIKITDDGCGMSPEDAVLCFAHHATSKINTVHDLQTIATYGFRGEALSSIASVSNVQLITKTETDKAATHLILKFGELMQQTHTSQATGTSLIITDLFENLPARKKFLKTDETEWTQIVTIFQAFALQHTQVHFKLFHNDHLVYNLAPTPTLHMRVGQIFDQHLHDQLLEVPMHQKNNITVSGAISSIHYHRFNRGQIFTFVNNRWVKNAEIVKGILKGYDGVLAHQKFPAAFIFVTVNPQEIDVNIHPKKEEVKFLHAHGVQKLIEEVVKQRLAAQIQQVLPEVEKLPELNLRSKPSMTNFDFLHSTASNLINNPSTTEKLTTLHNKKEEEKTFSSFVSPSFERESQPFTAIINQPTPLFLFESSSHTIIGQLNKTYIVIEKQQNLIIIDQHAAHERVLYERFKQNMGQTPSVHLLFPYILKLCKAQVTLLAQHQHILLEHGIVTDTFSDHEIVIQATPVQTSAEHGAEIIQMILKLLEQHEQASSQDIAQLLHEKIIAMRACKAACKAGDVLEIEQMNQLIAQLRDTENNFCCPHGRPTLWSLQQQEIDKHFKRDYQGAKDVLV